MSYDALAPFYERLETLVFGRALQRARCAPLEAWKGSDPRTVLILGDGDGRFLEAARRRWPAASITSIDQSEGMLALARKRTDSSGVRFVRGDARVVLEELDSKSFDVIVSHFFLDCFALETLGELVPQIARCLRPGGHWFVSEFTAQTAWQRCVLWVMYRFFNLTTETEATLFPNYGDVMRSNGLEPARLGTWRAGFIVADDWRPCPSGVAGA